MNVPHYIAKRYLRSKSSNNAINFITMIALTGVVLGAASLFVVLSGFAGLKDFTLQFSTIVDPDLKAETTIGKSFILTEAQRQELNNINGISLFSEVIEERVVVHADGKNYLASIKGVDKNFNKVNAIDSVIPHGNWLEQNTNQIVAGWGVSQNLSFGVLDYGKPVNIYVPKPGKGQITSTKNAFNTVRAINVGIFDINEKLNDTYVYAPISLARQLLNYQPNQISAMEFKLNDNADEAAIKTQIQHILGNNVTVKNRVQLNDALYKMLNSENLLIYLLLTLVSALLIFNVIGSIIMMILEKKPSLNTLFNLGVPIKSMRKIFFIQGSAITLIGCIVGLFLGFIIVLLQQTFGLVPITPTLAYPVSIKLENFIIVFLTISVLGVLSSKISATRVTEKLVTNH
ncbi:lipoprotein releasing system transmembrane protein lolC [Jejuia pallidilutea]|uniref:Lipoprotein releasing system transmembrane protein lolC n=2 Tax=Jejuia pallidilutea TaxID=504487 RepID=A0A090VQ52_9FLAO|nr:ABC transporter permease [Jejuia pallidilutea]GAL65444.1 lipoprotein releasing system transmembrane protein lolC [Jejuia pallidilutea]GAL73284.1 lipoprotein releasing system transmembrane protein lolC [Jejuia pallidilutea]GAL88998.1 lipoprotein releasing system transmembrane protein lolC [Jejuia pallidilutea]